MAAHTTPMDALSVTAWRSRDALFMTRGHLEAVERQVGHLDIEKAIQNAQQAAERATALVAELTALRALSRVIDLTGETAEDARQRIERAFDPNN